jgi:hypothetical protein
MAKPQWVPLEACMAQAGTESYCSWLQHNVPPEYNARIGIGDGAKLKWYLGWNDYDGARWGEAGRIRVDIAAPVLQLNERGFPTEMTRYAPLPRG